MSITITRPLLKFGQGNAKLAPWVTTFSLPAGHACPFAKDCRASSDRNTGQIKDGPQIEFRCYKASEEARYKTSRQSGWHNFRLLRKCKTTEEMADLVLDSLLPGAPIVRIHTGGDFFSASYFRSWLEVAQSRPRTLFYFYTKSLRYWAMHISEVGDGYTPGRVSNFIPTASWGGKDDALIGRHALRSALVVFSEQEAADRGLPIDHDDTHAMAYGPDFALLIHGTQPIGSEASKALSQLRTNGRSGYRRKVRLQLATTDTSLEQER